MIDTEQIEKTLKFLDGKFKDNYSHIDQQIPILYAKMAVLEYSGWLEETFDEIALSLKHKLEDPSYLKLIEEKLSHTHGFQYKKNVQPLLIHCLGIVKLEKIEANLNKNGNLDKLKSILGNITIMRNEAAHTYTSNTTSGFDAPSTIIGYFNTTKPILIQLWNYVGED